MTTKQKRARIDDSLHITLFDKPLSLVSSEKVLGVQVDNNLSWTDHVSKVSKKMSTNIWLLSKIKRNDPSASFIISYEMNTSVTVLQIRRSNKDNLGIIIHISS